MVPLYGFLRDPADKRLCRGGIIAPSTPYGHFWHCSIWQPIPDILIRTFILHKFGSGLFQAFLYFNYVFVRPSESPLEAQKAGPINSFFSASEDSFWVRRDGRRVMQFTLSQRTKITLGQVGFLYHISLCIIFSVQQRLHSGWLWVRVVMQRGCWASL